MTSRAQESGLKNKRIMFVSSLFPPHVLGGAEMCAYNMAQWVAGRGAIVGVMTNAAPQQEEVVGAFENGLQVWRKHMPRRYQMPSFPGASWWQKPLWHIQDHWDPRNRRIMRQVLEQFQPDLVAIHMIQGFGYNSLTEIGRRGIPAVFFLHDLGLACIRMSMFRNGQNCAQQCAACKLSASYKAGALAGIDTLFISASSAANLSNLAKYVPIGRWPTRVCLDVNRYPEPIANREEVSHVRFLYAGRLHPSKGVGLLLGAAERAILGGAVIQFTIAGSGSEEVALRRRYERMPWVKFLGFVSQQSLSNEMVNHDFLCVPSIWAENSPGVVVHALSQGLPVIGANRGGIPELVKHRRNGLIVESGSSEKWYETIKQVAADAELRNSLRAFARANQAAWHQDVLGLEAERWLVEALNANSAQPGTDSEIPHRMTNSRNI